MTTPGEAPFWQARVVVPFVVVALVWGSTWLVIKTQLGLVPAGWSVTWRFLVASLGMFVYAKARGDRVWLTGRGWQLALGMGLLQFTLNFQFVYRAESHVTSGIVAVIFALLLVPNALLARLFLGVRVPLGFIAGSVVAIAGIALLLIHEWRLAPPGSGVGLGLLFTALAVCSASGANVIQASRTAAAHPMVPVLAWAMLLACVIDAGLAGVLYGPPRFAWQAGYALGVLYLGLVGSVLTFPLYFQLIRDLGPGRAAYNSVAIPVVAMLLSTVFEGYRWSVLALAGSALALSGLVVALKARKPSRYVG